MLFFLRSEAFQSKAQSRLVQWLKPVSLRHDAFFYMNELCIHMTKGLRKSDVKCTPYSRHQKRRTNSTLHTTKTICNRNKALYDFTYKAPLTVHLTSEEDSMLTEDCVQASRDEKMKIACVYCYGYSYLRNRSQPRSQPR